MRDRVNHLSIYKLSYRGGSTGIKLAVIVLLILPVFLISGGAKYLQEVLDVLEIIGCIFLILLIFSLDFLLSYWDSRHGNVVSRITRQISISNNPIGRNSDIILYNNQHYDGVYYSDPHVYSSEISLKRYKYKIVLDNKKRVSISAFYSEEKYEKILYYAKMMRLNGYQYPLEFQYYTHGKLLVDVNLVEGIDYPERFITMFQEIKERL